MNVNTPFSHYSAQAFINTPGTPTTPTPRGRGRGTSTGAKRGRKPKGTLPALNVSSHARPQDPGPSSSQPTAVQWAQPITQNSNVNLAPSGSVNQGQGVSLGEQSQGGSQITLSLPGASTMSMLPVGAGGPSKPAAVDEDADDGDELLPAMADDDFAAQSSWNSQSKDNLKCAFRSSS